MGAVLAVVVLGAAGWLLLKPASSSSNAARPRVSPAASTLTPTAPRVTPTGANVMATATTRRAGAGKPTTAKALTKVAYLKAGNAVCVALTEDVSKLGPFPDGKPGGAYLTTLVRLAQGAQARLGRLRAPVKDAPQLQQIRTKVAHLLGLDRQLATALSHSDEQQIILLSPRVSAAEASMAAAYRAYGLTACG